MHGTASEVGSFVGGVVAAFVLSLAWEALVLRRVAANAVARKLGSVGMALITAGVLGGFGFAAVDRTFTWSAFGSYLAPAVVVAAAACVIGYGLRPDRP